MDTKTAVEMIRGNWPDSRYGGLREALEKAIAALEAVELAATTANIPSATIAQIAADLDRLAAEPTRNGFVSIYTTTLKQLARQLRALA